MGNQSSSPLFLVTDPHVAASLLYRAEQQDGYLAACAAHPANSSARRTYAPHPTPLTHHSLDIPLPRPLQRLPRIPIVPLVPSSDGGMPHSRPHMVCVPHIEQIKSHETMIHELWHVHQRLHQAEWTALFRSLGWQPFHGRLPTPLETYRRINPDTVDSPLWIFEQTWVPVPLFRDVVAPRITEADIWFYHVQEGYRQRTVPASLLALFPSLPPAAYEHPRELAAYTLASPEQYGETAGYVRLMARLERC